jgi:hypothetical protein
MPAIPRVDRLKNIYTSAKALNFAFRLSATNPQAVQFNGVADYQTPLHRITIYFCKNSYVIVILSNTHKLRFNLSNSEASAGMRNYIEHSLTKFATENPNCAIYVMPGQKCTPFLMAEYSNGRNIQIKAANSRFTLNMHIQ